MFMFFDAVKNAGGQAHKRADITGVINLKTRPISYHDVSLAYGDLVLIVAMLRDYVRTLDELRGDSIQYQVYYREKFMRIAKRIEEQTGYSYDAALKKCNKKEKQNDIGEDAMLLALKKQTREAKKKEEERCLSNLENSSPLKDLTQQQKA